MNPTPTRGPHGIANPFKGLRNIGAAARADLAVLGITSIKQLAASDPDQLFTLLQIKTARKHDPCVWDLLDFYARTQASTGTLRFSSGSSGKPSNESVLNSTEDQHESRLHTRGWGMAQRKRADKPERIHRQAEDTQDHQRIIPFNEVMGDKASPNAGINSNGDYRIAPSRAPARHA